MVIWRPGMKSGANDRVKLHRKCACIRCADYSGTKLNILASVTTAKEFVRAKDALQFVGSAGLQTMRFGYVFVWFNLL